jgi:hypothetical protein
MPGSGVHRVVPGIIPQEDSEENMSRAAIAYLKMAAEDVRNLQANNQVFAKNVAAHIRNALHYLTVTPDMTALSQTLITTAEQLAAAFERGDHAAAEEIRAKFLSLLEELKSAAAKCGSSGEFEVLSA